MMADQDEYTLYCPYSSVVNILVNSGNVINESPCCKMLHIVYATDALASMGMDLILPISLLINLRLQQRISKIDLLHQ